MDGMTKVLLFMASCVFSQNIVFVRLLGCCGLNEDRRVEAAAGYGVAVALVMTLASAGAWMVREWLLVPLNAGYLQLMAFVLVILIAAWIVERIAAKLWPGSAKALDGALPGVAANCAVLGIALVNLEKAYGLGSAVLSGLFSGLGFLLAVVLLAGVQERLESSRIPAALKGLPITLISASLIALAFMGFIGI